MPSFFTEDQFWQGLLSATSGIRVAAFFLAWVVLWLPLAIPLARRFNWQPMQPLTDAQKLPILAPLYFIAPLIIWLASRLESVPFLNYGFSFQPRIGSSLILGVGIGVLGLAIAFGLQSLLGWIEWNATKGIWSILLPTLLIALWISGTEELIFRGFLLTELQQDYSIWGAAIASSLIFALLHLVWERQETLPQIPGLWLMGMVLVLARTVDNGSLGLAWGLHTGWVWGIASLDTAQLISYTGKAPAWVTGIAEKPLAGLVGISCILGTGIAIFLIKLYS